MPLVLSSPVKIPGSDILASAVPATSVAFQAEIQSEAALWTYVLIFRDAQGNLLGSSARQFSANAMTVIAAQTTGGESIKAALWAGITTDLPQLAGAVS